MDEEQYQYLIDIYEDNPNYKIEQDELRNNLINVSPIIQDNNKQLGDILESISAKNEFCLANFKDLQNGRISQELFIQRVLDDLESSKILIQQGLDKAKNNKLATKLLTHLSDKEWNLTSDSFVKCLVEDCKDCIENWNYNLKLGKIEENQSMKYCFEKCLWCSRKRKDRKLLVKSNTLTPVENIGVNAETVSTTPKTDKLILQIKPAVIESSDLIRNSTRSNDIMLLGDKFFFVLLTAAREDGTDEYIIEILIKNFKQMFPPSYSAKAYIYNINSSPENTPLLYGLIRYNRENKHNITTKSTHIKNEIKPINGIKNKRYYNVINLTKYESKQYRTSRAAIVEKYNFIVGNNKTAVGDTLDEFLL
ncbi:Hypothetical protein HVR_LOCUS1042 [uncultured virus]|nr:Hypothetical protein HVR_LOCUS1042 [uncultured virus]